LGSFKLLLILTFILLIVAFSTPVNNTTTPSAAGIPDQNTCGTSKVASLYQTLSDIAAFCGTTVQALLLANPSIQDPNGLLPLGQRVMMPRRTFSSVTAPQIPNTGGQVEIVIIGPATSTPDPPGIPSTKTYTVQPGDTLSRLAVQFNTTTDQILKLNPSIKNPDIIFTGQVLVLP
jgi:LysM repeat protein